MQEAGHVGWWLSELWRKASGRRNFEPVPEIIELSRLGRRE
jgi:hypothetical protein